jgi:hypothetical protein
MKKNNLRQTTRVFGRFKFLCLLAALFTAFGAAGETRGQTAGDIKPSVVFDKAWVNYDTTDNGQKGMRVHAKFTVKNMKNLDSYLAIYFEKRDGTRLKDKNQRFYSATGEVALYRSLKPAYDATEYADLEVFMPYDELDLDEGKHELRMDFDLIYKAGGLIQHLTFYNFDYSQPSKRVEAGAPRVTFNKIWIEYDVVEAERKGMRIHAKFTAHNMKDIDSYLAVYFSQKNGYKLKTTNTKYASKEGQVAVYRSMKPGFAETNYDDLSVFIPYEELNLVRGTYDLQLDADIIYKAGTLLQHLDFHDFVFRNGVN